MDLNVCLLGGMMIKRRIILRDLIFWVWWYVFDGWKDLVKCCGFDNYVVDGSVGVVNLRLLWMCVK